MEYVTHCTPVPHPRGNGYLKAAVKTIEKPSSGSPHPRVMIVLLYSPYWIPKLPERPASFLTYNRSSICVMTFTNIPNLDAVRLHHLPDNVPDRPRDKGNNYLDNADNKPQNAHHQVEDQLQMRILW